MTNKKYCFFFILFLACFSMVAMEKSSMASAQKIEAANEAAKSIKSNLEIEQKNQNNILSEDTLMAIKNCKSMLLKFGGSKSGFAGSKDNEHPLLVHVKKLLSMPKTEEITLIVSNVLSRLKLAEQEHEFALNQAHDQFPIPPSLLRVPSKTLALADSNSPTSKDQPNSASSSARSKKKASPRGTGSQFLQVPSAVTPKAKHQDTYNISPPDSRPPAVTYLMPPSATPKVPQKNQSKGCFSCF